MRCDEFQDRWQQLLDERRSPELDGFLTAHAAECRECAELLELQAAVFATLPLCTATQPPQLAQRTRIPSNSKSMRKAAFSVALAASLMLLLVPGIRQTLRSWRSGGLPVAVVGQAVRSHAALTVPPATSDSDNVAIPLEAYTSPAEQEALRNLMNDMAAKFSAEQDRELESLDWIAGGFRPLADTIGVAWDALRRTIPVKRDESINEPQAIRQHLQSKIWSRFSV